MNAVRSLVVMRVCMIVDYLWVLVSAMLFFFFQAEDGIRDIGVTGVQTCALPIFDNAVRGDRLTGLRIRTDLSVTLFLSEPDEYDGGELVVEDRYGSHEIKLQAGDLALYPASSLHMVAPVTRGMRVASCF